MLGLRFVLRRGGDGLSAAARSAHAKLPGAMPDRFNDDAARRYRALGFSEAAADAYTRMTAAALDDGFGMIADPIRGEITLAAYLEDTVRRASA